MRTNTMIMVVAVVVLSGATTTTTAQSSHAFVWDVHNGITDLGCQDYGIAYAVNDSGLVVGAAGRPNETLPSACVWDPTTGVNFLGVLPGYPRQSYALGVNSTGQVVGEAESLYQFRAFLWDKTSGIRALSRLPGWEGNYAVAINDVGQAVGASDKSYAGEGPFISCPTLWDPVAGVVNLDPAGLHGRGCAMDINNVGQVVGYFDNENIGFIWDSVNGMEYLPFYPKGINDRGEVAGWNLAYGTPCVWDRDKGIRSLELLPGDNGGGAQDINNLGQVIGFSRLSNERFRAVLWNPQGVIQQLPSLGGNMTVPEDINNIGQVVGQGTTPEPATLSLLALGGMAVLRRRRR